jgi:hypothetical protein
MIAISSLSAQGSFNIEKFTDPQKYGWEDISDRLDYRADLFERQKLLQIYEMEAQSISGNILKSSIFPGWGQFNAKQYTKGQVFLALEIGLLGASYFFYDRSQDNYEKYQNATQIDQMNAYYNDAEVPYKYSLVFLTLAASVWAYNIFDVVQSTENYNSEVWQKTMKTYYKSPVQLTPAGVEIRF